jgi:hypothetical protein
MKDDPAARVLQEVLHFTLYPSPFTFTLFAWTERSGSPGTTGRSMDAMSKHVIGEAPLESVSAERTQRDAEKSRQAPD